MHAHRPPISFALAAICVRRGCLGLDFSTQGLADIGQALGWGERAVAMRPERRNPMHMAHLRPLRQPKHLSVMPFDVFRRWSVTSTLRDHRQQLAMESPKGLFEP